jgi:hypothetical protein
MSCTPSSSTDRRWRRAGGLLLGLVLGLAAPALGQEAAPVAPARPPATVILSIMGRSPESPEAALAESLRPDAGPPSAARPDGPPEVLPDGSVRYRRGPTTVIIKNSCPEGDPFQDRPRPLPGRTRR